LYKETISLRYRISHNSSIVFDGVLNPLVESGDARVNSWLSWPSTSNSPRDNAQNSPFPVDLFHYGATGIALATVHAANTQLASTEHGIRDHVSIDIGPLASGIRDEWNCDHLKSRYRARGVGGLSAAPSRDNHVASGGVVVVFIGQFGQAGRLRVAVESQVLAQLQKGDVIVLSISAILRMSEVPLNLDYLFTPVIVTNVVVTSNNFHAIAPTCEAVCCS